MSDEQESGTDIDEPGQDHLDSFFADDDPASEDSVEDAEVEDGPDDDGSESELDAEGDESPDAEDPAPEPESPDLSELQSKELQRLQQLNATYEKQLAAHQANPTPETAAKVEKTKSRLDAIVESGKDVDPYEASIQLAQEAKAQEAALADLKKSVADGAGMSSKQAAALQQQMARIQFRLDHPALGDRYDELAKAAASEVDGMLGEAIKVAPPQVLAQLDNAAFMRLVEAERAKLEAGTETATEAPPPRKKPVATNPVKNKSGKSSKPDETEDQRIERLLGGLL